MLLFHGNKHLPLSVGLPETGSPDPTKVAKLRENSEVNESEVKIIIKVVGAF